MLKFLHCVNERCLQSIKMRNKSLGEIEYGTHYCTNSVMIYRFIISKVNFLVKLLTDLNDEVEKHGFLAVILSMVRRLVLRAIINHMQSTKARMLTKKGQGDENFCQAVSWIISFSLVLFILIFLFVYWELRRLCWEFRKLFPAF